MVWHDWNTFIILKSLVVVLIGVGDKEDNFEEKKYIKIYGVWGFYTGNSAIQSEEKGMVNIYYVVGGSCYQCPSTLGGKTTPEKHYGCFTNMITNLNSKLVSHSSLVTLMYMVFLVETLLLISIWSTSMLLLKGASRHWDPTSQEELHTYAKLWGQLSPHHSHLLSNTLYLIYQEHMLQVRRTLLTILMRCRNLKCSIQSLEESTNHCNS